MKVENNNVIKYLSPFSSSLMESQQLTVQLSGIEDMDKRKNQAQVDLLKDTVKNLLTVINEVK